MRIVISDDYQNCVSTLDCFAQLKDHDVVIFNDTVKTIDAMGDVNEVHQRVLRAIGA